MKALTGEKLCLLTAICASCHRYIEFNGGKKVTNNTANRRMKDYQFRRTNSGLHKNI